MSNPQPSNNVGSAYKVNIDVILKGTSNTEVQQKLLQWLRSNPDIIDVQMNVCTGQSDPEENSSGTLMTSSDSPTREQNSPKQATSDSRNSNSQPIEVEIEQYISNQTLVRLQINKGKGVRLSLPTRILNFDHSNMLLNVYHVDEKKVYAFYLYEVEDMSPFSA